MKIFVPRYRHDLPPSNTNVLNAMFSEIEESDLPRVIKFWQALDVLAETKGSTGKDFFRQNIKGICERPVQKGTLEPFLRRPHVTVHCGAKDELQPTRELAEKTMYETGALVAEHGFNLWYGGGDQGLMGYVLRGFLDAVAKDCHDDQCSIQIIPGSFVLGVESRNGLHPANEGLCTATDAAVVLPDFVTRRELLSNKCVAAISGFGGVGTLDELTDILVHIKTGLRTTRSYILNPYTPALERGYWEPLLELINGFIKVGSESAKTLEHVHFKASPQEVFAHLMEELDAAGQNPETVYREYLRTRNVELPATFQKGGFQATPS